MSVIHVYVYIFFVWFQSNYSSVKGGKLTQCFVGWCSLETTLRNYSCLTTGDSIMVAYNNKKYYIDIVETKPSNAISIIETDCEVDFAPPLDYTEPEKPVARGKAAAAQGKLSSPQTLTYSLICLWYFFPLPTFSLFVAPGNAVEYGVIVIVTYIIYICKILQLRRHQQKQNQNLILLQEQGDAWTGSSRKLNRL